MLGYSRLSKLVHRLVHELAPSLQEGNVELHAVLNEIAEVLECDETPNKKLSNLLYGVFMTCKLPMKIRFTNPSIIIHGGEVTINYGPTEMLTIYDGVETLLTPIIAKILRECANKVPESVSVSTEKTIEKAEISTRKRKATITCQLKETPKYIKITASIEEPTDFPYISIEIANYFGTPNIVELRHDYFIDRKQLLYELQYMNPLDPDVVYLLLALPVAGTADKTELILYRLEEDTTTRTKMHDIAELWIHNQGEIHAIAFKVDYIGKIADLLTMEDPNIIKRKLRQDKDHEIIILELLKR